MNFSGIYAIQPLGIADPEIIKLSDITGTSRYCDKDAEKEISKRIARFSAEGIHFLDSGNYHYASKFWTDKITEPFALVVFDHHTDMQPPRFPGLLSCGSWVKEVLDKNRYLRGTVIAGVSSQLISYVGEEYKAKVRFLDDTGICEERAREDIAELFENLPVYISIDKDALRREDAATDWDQGSLSLTELEDALSRIFKTHRILGIDICGESSNANDARGIALNSHADKELLHFLQTFSPEVFQVKRK